MVYSLFEGIIIVGYLGVWALKKLEFPINNPYIRYTKSKNVE